MKTSHEFGHVMIQALRDAGMTVRIVNDEVDEDSVVEHDLDIDITYDGVDWNIFLTVIRIGRTLRII